MKQRGTLTKNSANRFSEVQRLAVIRTTPELTSQAELVTAVIIININCLADGTSCLSVI